MAEGANIKVILDSLGKARKYYEEKNYGRSFAHYLVVFQLLEPDARQQYEKEFTTVLHLWGSILHQRGKYEDIFRCYHLATTYFPNCVEILNNLGVHALKLQCHRSAKVYFESSLLRDPNFLPAEQNLQSARYALVERWHFPMLNDVIRNKSYAQAIFLEISHGYNNILDIGMGTGILSLFASKSKQCKSITACDYSETMYEIATKVMEANNVTNVKLIKKKSTYLSVGQDMKKRASLLITEIMDSGVFGENILETLIHAWEQLLNPFPYGRVIPARVSLYITGLQSLEISRKSRYIPTDSNILKLNEFCIYRDTEPYDTENLRSVNFTHMTDTQACLFVDFNNIFQLRVILETADQNPRTNLICLKSGRIDCFAVWFKLHLNDDITLSNDPKGSVRTCWEQAIINLKHPLTVVENESIEIQMSCVSGQLGIAECKQSNNMPHTCQKLHEKIPKCYMVSKDEIYFLNDELFLKTLQYVTNSLMNHFRNCDNITVLDLTPFPILGLLLAQHGAQVTCRVKNKEFIEELAIEICKANDISTENITFVSAQDFNDYTSADLEFDIVFQTLISASGLLYEAEIFQAQIMKYSLSKRGVYLPKSVTVWAQIVECDWLNQATKVDDKNVCGFKIAPFINEYKSTEQQDLNLNTLEYTQLSEPVKLDVIKYNVTKACISKTAVPIIQTGTANAIFYWFELNLYENTSISTRRAESFVNNAAFMLDPPITLSTDNIVHLALKQHNGIIKIFLSEPD